MRCSCARGAHTTEYRPQSPHQSRRVPQTLLERCRAQGVAPVTWQRIGGGVRQPPPAAAAAAAAATGGGGGGGGMRLPAAQSPVNHPHHEHEQQEHGHRLRHRGFPPPEEQEQETEQRYDSGFGSRGGLDDGGSASESEDGDGRSGAGTESGEAAAAWPVRPGLSPRLQVAGSGAAAAAAAAAGEEADYTGRVAIASGGCGGLARRVGCVAYPRSGGPGGRACCCAAAAE